MQKSFLPSIVAASPLAAGSLTRLNTGDRLDKDKIRIEDKRGRGRDEGDQGRSGEGEEENIPP